MVDGKSRMKYKINFKLNIINKNKMIKIILIYVGFFSVSNSQNHFMPNLPFGEYRVVTEKIYPCESTRNHSIKFNLYFSKKTSNITELKGNVTTLIPFDDTLICDINLSSWGSTGGWIPNTYIIITKKPCSTLKNLIGNAWLKSLNYFNAPSSCPIPANIYITSGMDSMVFIKNHNFPKVYFYGKYKSVIKIKNMKNELLGCMNFEFSLIRPWEKPV
ncbi:uncharacterized protein LOC126548858 [Aphis gossypii]|uniref:uncharacterized protein LOC126548858 n=1 Tax=Aphis gossypii TaxID=80765 RepID=UPI002158F978|nr:uncharacterized protein LOC126548858 [Aphis gossypii]